ncbi:hypothetical protein [Falsiroseomonas sp. CW058]|uniref:hypothetical protein n=1 Tax=Falsiroseomonas sp. CW058 TaxID=3388664 RepID=UPI003D323149
MTAAQLRQVTLARAWEPGAPGAQGERIEFSVALDPGNMPDAQAWQDDPAPWPTALHLSDAPPQAGEVLHDEDGWMLRFSADPDVPSHRLCHLGGGLRPGEVLTLRGPDGRESAWRVVGVT